MNNPNFAQWLIRLKQNCYDINWEVRQQCARQFYKVIFDVGILRACSDGTSGVMKEFEDLMEDEEEEVVCGALESAVKIIRLFDIAYHHDK